MRNLIFGKYFWLAAVLIIAGCGPSPAEKRNMAQAAREARLKWNTDTLVGAYQSAGHTDPKWDGAAKGALLEFARSRSGAVNADENCNDIISNDCVSANSAGCTDPMIRYLSVRFASDQSQSKEWFVDAFNGAANGLEDSSYPPIRKYYGWLRAAGQARFAYGYGTNIPQSIRAMNLWGRSETDLLSAFAWSRRPGNTLATHECLPLGRPCFNSIR
jgi:hypothetical protein